MPTIQNFTIRVKERTIICFKETLVFKTDFHLNPSLSQPQILVKLLTIDLLDDQCVLRVTDLSGMEKLTKSNTRM